MSTRCTLHFGYGDKPAAIIYRHSDGYPDGVLPDLERFFADVEAQTKDTRFDDPTYLAAKFVVWQANDYVVAARKYPWRKGETVHMLDFLSVGVMLRDPGDIEYRYLINCGQHDAKERPTITVVDLHAAAAPAAQEGAR